LIARTEGNPFFLEESVRTLVETGVLVGEPGAYRLAQALPTIQVPATVQAVLAARIDRLPSEEKRLLQTAAVIGTEVPLLLLQATADVPEEALYRSLARLQAAEFLYYYSGKYMLKQPLAEARRPAVCSDNIWRAVDATGASGTRRGPGGRSAARRGPRAIAAAESRARSAGGKAPLGLEGGQAARLLNWRRAFF
jgi:hypothetical protein